MSLSADLDALRLASLAKAALSASIPPCRCGGTAWVAGPRSSLLCAGCGRPAGGGGDCLAPGNPTHPDGAGMPAHEAGSLVGGVSRDGDGAGPVASEVAASGAEPRSANPARSLLTDPDRSGGGPHFQDVTIELRETAGDGEIRVNRGPSAPGDRETISPSPVALEGVARATEAQAAVPVEIGVLRGRVQKQRKGTAEFYEDAKSAHRRGMRRIRKFIAECEAQEAADRLLSRAELLARPAEEGGKYRYEALRDPHYKWALQEAGKFAHSQAPKEVKAETRLLIEFDMGG